MLDFIVYWTTDRRIRERNQMLDAVAHASAVRLLADESRSALPTSPVRPEHRHRVRRELSVTLRWLADRLDPALAKSGMAAAEVRDGHYRREAATI